MKMRYGLAAVLAVVSMAAFAPSAFALARVTSTSTASGQDFQAVRDVTTAGTVATQFNIGTNFNVTCTTATITGKTPAMPSATIQGAPAFSGCNTKVAGVNYTTTVTCTSNTIIKIDGTNATFNTSTGKTTGIKVTFEAPGPSGTTASCTITLSGTSCVVTITATNPTPIVVDTAASAQNYTAGGALSPANGAPAYAVITTNPTTGTIPRVASAGCGSIGGPTGSANDGRFQGSFSTKAHTVGATNYVGLWATP